MQWTEPAEARSRLLHAVILLSLVSADMSRLAAGTLGRNSMGNREIQVLLLVRAHPGLTPSAVAASHSCASSLTSQSAHASS